jgi:antitoxin component HigA of HigAB toxin-antitoxin module
MEWNIIKTNAQYIEALKRMILILDAAPGSAEAKEFAVLQNLLTKYEKKHTILPEPDLMRDY